MRRALAPFPYINMQIATRHTTPVFTPQLSVSLVCRHMLNVTWERKDLSFNSQGFLSNPSMVIIALDRERTWDKVAAPTAHQHRGLI